MNPRLPILLLAALTAAGCGPSWSGTPQPELDGNGVSSAGGATVVTAEELHEARGSALRAIQGKVPNMKVNYVGSQRCPSITLRNYEDHRGFNFPDIYVDGTRAQDTCILDSLNAYDVSRIEVYPMGFTRRPGYGTSTHGLILVFTRRT